MTAEQPGDRFLPLEEALRWLVADLDNVLPLNPGENSDDEDLYFYERAQIIAVVIAVTKFMMSIPELEGKGWDIPLFTLTSALGDVHEEGLNSQLFSPRRKRGKPKPPTVDQYTRALAAAAMQFFFEANGRKNLEEAAQRVVDRLVYIGNSRLFTGKSAPHNQVKTWRDNFMGVASDEGGKFYQSLVAMGKATGLGPEQTAKNLLKLLSRKSF